MSHVAFNIGDRWKIITRATNKKHAQCSCPKAQRRATKEYYPPHLTGHGSRGVGPLDMVLFEQGLNDLSRSTVKIEMASVICSRNTMPI